MLLLTELVSSLCMHKGTISTSFIKSPEFLSSCLHIELPLTGYEGSCSLVLSYCGTIILAMLMVQFKYFYYICSSTQPQFFFNLIQGVSKILQYVYTYFLLCKYLLKEEVTQQNKIRDTSTHTYIHRKRKKKKN